MMKKKDKALMLDFKGRLPKETEEHLKRLIVFGSRARGDATEDSDLDAVALVDERTFEIEKKLDDIVYQVMWDHNFKPIISLKIFAESQFNDALKNGFSFYRYIEKEGVSL